jgi:hypothetical protein
VFITCSLREAGEISVLLAITFLLSAQDEEILAANQYAATGTIV